MQHVVSQLITKRQELVGEFAHYQRKVFELEEQILAIDKAVILFDPKIRPKEFRPKRFSGKKRYFSHGEALVLIYDLLREAGEPVATIEIVKAIIQKKGLDASDKELYNGITGAIRSRLYDQQKKGILVLKSDGPGKDGYWSINPN